MYYFRQLLLLLYVFPLSVHALGLGEATGQMVIGLPLAIRVPLLGPEAATVAADCVRILPANGEAIDASLKAAVLRIDKGAVLIASRLPVSEPLLSFRLNVACGFQINRDYQLLPAPPGSGYSASAAPGVPDVARPAASLGSTVPTATTATSAPTTPAAPAAPRVSPAPGGYTLAASTTLRMMSRQRYPQDSRARVTFIHRVAAANPEVFATVEDAFDQRLPAGVQLRMPDTLPRQMAKEPAASAPRPVVKAPQQTRDNAAGKASGKGRLIIGSDVPESKSVIELEADVERLTGIMNDQVLIQISMAERLKTMESEVAQAKLAVMAQQSANQRLEADIRELRDEQRRNSYIQLVMAILLGGFAVASFLLWRGQQRRPERVEEDVIPVRPEPKPVQQQQAQLPPKSVATKLRSVLDDLTFK